MFLLNSEQNTRSVILAEYLQGTLINFLAPIALQDPDDVMPHLEELLKEQSKMDVILKKLQATARSVRVQSSQGLYRNSSDILHSLARDSYSQIITSRSCWAGCQRGRCCEAVDSERVSRRHIFKYKQNFISKLSVARFRHPPKDCPERCEGEG